MRILFNHHQKMGDLLEVVSKRHEVMLLGAKGGLESFFAEDDPVVNELEKNLGIIVDLWDVFSDLPGVDRDFLNGLLSYALDNVRTACKCLTAIRNISQNKPFDVAVLLDDWAGPVQVVAKEIARQGGKNVVIMHGTPAAVIVRPFIADYYAVYGDRDYYYMSEVMGVDKRRIAITGNPEWALRDSLQGHNADTSGPMTLMFVSSWGDDSTTFRNMQRGAIECLLRSLLMINESKVKIRLIIKCHPHDEVHNVGWYEQVCNHIGADYVEIRKEGLEECLDVADAVIGPFVSTVFVLAMRRGMPIYLMDDGQHAHYVNISYSVLKKCEGMVRVSLSQLNGILSDFAERGEIYTHLRSKVKDAAVWYSGDSDGKAVARILSLLEDRCGKPTLLMIGFAGGGGTQYLTRDLTRALSGNYHVVLVENEGSGDFGKVVEGVDVVDYWVHGIKSIPSELEGHVLLDNYGWLDEIINKVKPDLVHIQHMAPYGAGIISHLKKARIPVVTSLHDFWPFCAQIQRMLMDGSVCEGPIDGGKCGACMASRVSGLASDPEKWKMRLSAMVSALNLSDRVITNSKCLKDFSISYGVDGVKTIVSHPSVASVDTLQSSAEIDMSEGMKLRVGYLGALIPPKGADILLSALSSLPPHIQERVSLQLWGAQPSANFMEVVYSRSRGLQDVHIMGVYDAMKDLAGILRNIDVIVVPSVCPETFGMTVEESIAARVPVVASDICGLREHILPGINGELFPPGDAAALAGILEKLALDSQLLVSWRGNLRAPRLLKDYARHLHEIYSDLLNMSRPYVIGSCPASTDIELVQENRNQRNNDHEKLNMVQDKNYQDWCSRHKIELIDAQIFAERRLFQWGGSPVLNIFMLVLKGEEAQAHETIDTLLAQLYSNWQLVLMLEAEVLSGLVVDDRIKTVDMNKYQRIDEAIADYVVSDGGDWLTYVSPGVRFSHEAAFVLFDYVNKNAGWKMVYVDDDLVDKEGRCASPRFKPDIDFCLLRSSNYVGDVFVRVDAFFEIGGLGAHLTAENYSMALRATSLLGASAIGHIQNILLHYPKNPVRHFSVPNMQAALVEHLADCGIDADLMPGFLSDTWQVRYRVNEYPLVSIVIPNRDAWHLLTACINSLIDKTDYSDYEIIVVDNQTTDPDVMAFYEELNHRLPARFKLVLFDQPFNFSMQINLGVAAASGDAIVLLNNDTVIVQNDWLSRMMGILMQNGVGVVGARLVYPESAKLQHAGLVFGLMDVVGRPYVNAAISDPGHVGVLQSDHLVSAVSAACMAFGKGVFEHVGGFDETEFPIYFNGADFCLRVKAAGLVTVWSPQVTLIHEDQATLAQSADDLDRKYNLLKQRQDETDRFLAKWPDVIAGDPQFNKHLSLTSVDVMVDPVMVAQWDTSFHDRPRLLCFPDSGTAGRWRLTDPAMALGRAGIIQSTSIEMNVWGKGRVPLLSEIMRLAPDKIAWHNPVNDAFIERLEQIKKYLGIPQYFAMDDLLFDLPDGHPVKNGFFRDIRARVRRALSCCDRLVVSTEPIAAACAGMIDDIVVAPNRLSRDLWSNLVSKRRVSRKPRIGWAGAQQHHGDLAMMVDVVKATAKEVDWVFMGMALEELRPFVREEHPFEKLFERYPKKLASLDLDIAIAPLAVNRFNEAKSNLRLLEYGIMGWPVIASDIYPYRTNNAPVLLVNNDANSWIEAIRMYANDLELPYQEGDRLKQWVEAHYMLEDHLDDWARAFDVLQWHDWAVRDHFAPNLRPLI